MLSDGYRAVIGLFTDLARRCAGLNPDLGGDAPMRTPGVVLIDELELHLHPAWQQRIVNDLVRVFPAIQLIVTTHSPLVLSDAAQDGVRLLERGQGGASRVRDLDLRLGLTVDQVLTGPWFQLTTTLDDDTRELMERYHRAGMDGEEGEREQLGAKLRARLGRWDETSLEEVVRAVARTLRPDLAGLSWPELQALRARTIAAFRAQGEE